MTDTTFTIHPINPEHGRMYCGPTVLAMLTGHSRETIHADVNRLKRKAGKKRNKTVRYPGGTYKTTRRVAWPLTARVTGLSNSFLEKLMVKYGLSPAFRNCQYGSLAQLVKDIGHFKQPIVINVTGHYVLYFNGMVFDTLRKQGVPVSDHPSARQRVQRYWLIRKQAGV